MRFRFAFSLTVDRFAPPLSTTAYGSAPPLSTTLSVGSLSPQDSVGKSRPTSGVVSIRTTTQPDPDPRPSWHGPCSEPPARLSGPGFDSRTRDPALDLSVMSVLSVRGLKRVVARDCLFRKSQILNSGVQLCSIISQTVKVPKCRKTFASHPINPFTKRLGSGRHTLCPAGSQDEAFVYWRRE